MKPTKLLALIVFVVGISTQCTAVANSHASPYDGFYAGIDAGSNQISSKILMNSSIVLANEDGSANTLAFNQDINVNQTQGGGSVYLGYGQVIHSSNLYLGGEIFADFFPHSMTANDSAFHLDPFHGDSQTFNAQTTVKLHSGEVGIDLRPAFLLGRNVIAYGRVGMAFNQLTLSSNVNFSYSNLVNNIIVTSPLSTNSTKNITGLRLGLGLETYICKNISLTADYIYTSYGKVSANHRADATAFMPSTEVVIGELSHQSSVNVETQSVLLGIKYYFG